MSKESVERELSDFFVGKLVAVEDSDSPDIFHVGMQDMVWVKGEFFSGWQPVLVVVVADLRETKLLSRTKHELEFKMKEAVRVKCAEAKSD